MKGKERLMGLVILTEILRKTGLFLYEIFWQNL